MVPCALDPMSDPTDRPPRASSVPRAAILALFVLLLLRHQASVGAVADAALEGAEDGASRLGAFARAAVPLGLSGALLLFAGRLRSLLLAGAGAFFVLLLCADVAYLRVFERPFSVDLLVLLGQGWTVRESAVRLLSVGDAATLAGVLALGAVDAALAVRRRAGKRLAGRLVGVGLVVFALPHTTEAWRLLDRQGARLREVFVDLETVRTHGALLYHVADLGRAFRREASAAPLDPRREEALTGAIARRWAANRAESPLRGVAAGRSVVFLQLESVESFVVGRTVAGGALTPNLDRLRGEALEFDRCHDLAAAGRTSDAEFMVLTSLRPDPVRPVAYGRPTSRPSALPRRLADDGYRTLSLHAYEPWFWNRAVAHPLYGIREMWFDETFHEGERLFLGLGDVDFLRQAAARLARVPRPFFALCITLSCHHPFATVPERLAGFDVGFDDDSMAAGYLRLVRYTDEAVGVFLRALEASGLAEECVLVVYGDHVSGLPAESRRRLAERLGVELEPVSAHRVPLLVAIPGEEAALRAERERVRDAACSLQDVPPTVLHLLGREVPAGWLGTHLLVDPSRRPVVPLRGGLGISGPDGAEDDPSAIAGTRAFDEAQEELRFAETMRAADGQARAAALSRDELVALADARPVRFATEADAAPWEVRFESPARPLDVGVRVLPFLPFPPAPVEAELVLRNRSAVEISYRLEAFGVDGALAATRAGVVGATEESVVPLSRDADLAATRALWARLAAGERLDASLRLRSPFGDVRRDLADRTAARTAVVGGAGDVETALVLVVNPGDAPLEARIRVEVAGDPPREVTRSIAARGAATERVRLDRRLGEVRVEVEGDGAVVRVVRFSHGGRRIR